MVETQCDQSTNKVEVEQRGNYKVIVCENCVCVCLYMNIHINIISLGLRKNLALDSSSSFPVC